MIVRVLNAKIKTPSDINRVVVKSEKHHSIAISVKIPLLPVPVVLTQWINEFLVQKTIHQYFRTRSRQKRERKLVPYENELLY